jgi:hypothetical protein
MTGSNIVREQFESKSQPDNNGNFILCTGSNIVREQFESKSQPELVHDAKHRDWKQYRQRTI